MTPSVDAPRGGLQEYGARLAANLAASGRVAVVVHALNQTPEDGQGDGFRLRPLYPMRARLAAPLGESAAACLRLAQMPAQGFQINEIVLHRSLAAELERAERCRHVLVSFSFVRVGFTVQRLADRLGLPHVATVTGSDFALDMADPALHGAAARIAGSAAWIVTANESQRGALERAFGRGNGVSVSHGALPRGRPAHRWQAHDREEVTIVSDVGYSQKKATHLLIDACDRLHAARRPLRLVLVGRTAHDEADFWNEYRCEAARARRPWARLEGPVAKDDIEDLLLSGDIYCSPSLGEGSSNAVLCALALGMPLVCTRTGSLPELSVGMGASLLLVPPGDADALSDALDVMIGRITGGVVAGPHARTEALRRQLSWQVELGHWIDVIERVSDGS